MTGPPTHSDRATLIRRIAAVSHHLEPIPTEIQARTPPLDDIRAVLLDVYGTMLISASGDVGVREARDDPAELSAALRSAAIRCDHEKAAERALELLPQRIEIFHTALRARNIRFPEIDIRVIWKGILQTLHDEDLLRGEIETHAVERLAVEYECRVNPVWPMPGLIETLRAIRNRGIPLGIVSNAQFFTPLLFPALLDEFPDTLGFHEDLCVWSYTILQAKPATVLYHRALKPLKDRGEIESPHQVLYVGNDIRNDILPASKLGCRTALFAGDQRSLRLRQDDPDCQDIQPDAILKNLSDLLNLLKT